MNISRNFSFKSKKAIAVVVAWSVGRGVLNIGYSGSESLDAKSNKSFLLSTLFESITLFRCDEETEYIWSVSILS